MRVPNLKSVLGVTVLAAFGLATAMGFNSCSDVEFAKAVGAVSLQCEGPLCPGPTDLANFESNFTVPAGSNKADVLLVLDNSGSMTADLAELADKLDGLIEVLDAGAVDWRMCYLTTNEIGTGLSRDWKVGSGGKKVLVPSTPNKRQVFLDSINGLPRDGTGNEEGIATLRQALGNADNADCFRADAVLSVVLISDEDEKSCGARCKEWKTNEIGGLNPRECGPPDARRPCTPGEEYRAQYRLIGDANVPANLVSYVDSKWPKRPFVFSPIVIKSDDRTCYQAQDLVAPAFFGMVYGELQNLTGGVLGNICAGSYATQLREIGQRTKETVSSVTLECPPVSQPTVTITPRAAGQTWSLSGNKVLFSPALPEGTMVNVKYTCAVPKI